MRHLQTNMVPEEKRAIYRSLFFVNFLSCLGLAMFDTFLPIYAAQNGAKAFHIALMFSGYSAAKMLISPLSGWWSDRYGRLVILIAGLTVYVMAALFFLFLSNILALVILKLSMGFAAGIVRPVLLAFVADTVPDRREGAAMGFFDISFYGALAIGPLIGGVLRDAFGFQAIFWCLTVMCLLSLATALIFCNKGPRVRKSIRSRGQSKVFRVTRTIAGLSVFIFTKSFGITLLMIFLPLFMSEKLHMKGVEIGMIMASVTVITAVLLRPMGLLSDKIDRHSLVTLGGTMAALLIFCLPFTNEFYSFLFIIAVMGIFSTVSLPASSALLVKEGSILGMGATVGIFTSAMNFGALTAPLAGSLCLTYFGMNKVFYMIAAVSLAGAIIFWLLMPPVSSARSRSVVSVE